VTILYEDNNQTDSGMGASCLALDGFEINLPLANAAPIHQLPGRLDDDFEEGIASLARRDSHTYL